MKKTNIILDLDNTLMDYKYTDKYAMECVYEILGIPFSDEEYERFYDFEGFYWRQFEDSKQELDTHGMERIDYVRSKIYQDYFGEHIVPLSLGYELMVTYIKNLGVKNKLYEDVEDILKYLHESYNLYIASNGPHESQERKLKNTDILKYFKGIVTSEDAMYSKPKQEFFDYLIRIYDIVPRESVFIGDSLTSDILGANNNNMYSIWYNRNRIKNNTSIIPKKEIHDLKVLKRIL